MIDEKDIRKLWFDVGIKRYTTRNKSNTINASCGLMKESKDIQPAIAFRHSCEVVV